MFKGASNIFIVVGLVFAVTTAHAVNSEDPLRPPGHRITENAKADKKQPQTWYVNEILRSEGRRIAIVNNTMVKHGDFVNGARVIDITADQVTLKYKDRIIASRLNLVPVKKLKTNKNNTGR